MVVSLKEYGIVTILLLVVILEQLVHLSSSTKHNNNPTCPLNVENNGIIKATIIMGAIEWVVYLCLAVELGHGQTNYVLFDLSVLPSHRAPFRERETFYLK